MPYGRPWQFALGLRAYMMLIFALFAIALLELLQGSSLQAAVTVAALLACLVGVAPAAVAIVACLLAGAYLSVLLALGMIAAELFGRRGMRARFDPQALAAASSCPQPLRDDLLEVAGGGPITTRSMLALAAAEEATLWAPWLECDPGEGAADGPLLHAADGAEYSQYAAEALVLARAVAESSGRPLDARLLGAIAAMIPRAAAAGWLRDRGLPEDVVGVGPAEVVAAAKELALTPAGVDMSRRVEGLMRSSTAPGLVAGVDGVATTYAYLAVAGELLLDLLRWIVSLPRRMLRLPRRLWRSPAPRPSRLRGRWRRLAAPWAAWPGPLRLLWLCGRPLLGLAAAVCIVTFGTLPIWLGLPAALAALAARSVRRPWIPLAAAAAAALVSPAGAALLASRALLSEAGVWWLGRGGAGKGIRRRGLDAVFSARLEAGGRVTGYPAESLSAARGAFDAALARNDEDAVMEAASAYAVAAWAAWRWWELARLGSLVTRGVLRGQWSGPVEEAGLFDRELMSLSLLEELLVFLVRWLVLLLAAVVASLVVTGAGGLLGGEALPGRLTAAVATALIAAALSRRQIGFVSAAFWSALAWLMLGMAAWQVVAIAVAAAFAARALRRLGEVLSFGGRSRWRSWPAPKWRPWRLRRQWAAASKAIDSGEERIGVEMLKELAHDAGSDEAYRTAALGRAALVEVDLGRLQAAAAHLDRISAQRSDLKGTAAVAAGILASTLGDDEAALPVLRDALADLDRSSPLAPRATLALAQVLARTGDPDQALALVASYGARPFALRGVAAILEVQTAIAAALLERARGSREDLQRAEKLLSQFDDFIGPKDVELLNAGMSPEALRRLQRVQAELLALHGQLLLASRPGEAAPYLGRAVALAGEGGDEALRARAQVLHGSALARSGEAGGAAAISEGIEVLERRRVQLRRGERRTAMIAAGETLYSAALDGYRAAGRRGDPRAGMEAAKLVESLRQSALAATLRGGPLPLDEEAHSTLESVLEGERTAADVDELRGVVGRQISDRFAAAYLPTSVTEWGLLQACRGFDHVLAFHVPIGGGPAWRIWIARDGTAVVDTVGAHGQPSALLAEITSAGRLPASEIHRPLASPAAAATWERLGEELLPVGLRQELLRAEPERPQRILLVPDGPLALVPWAALRVGGRALIENAILQAVPALELAGTAEPVESAREVVAHLPALDVVELEALSGRGKVTVTSSRDAFLGALDDGVGGAYMASHGRLDGLRQEVEFADGSTLSAAAALAYEWPPWTVFSSCLVGRVDHLPGREPFGLAISCMLRGTNTVLASVVELTEQGARVCGEATAALADGTDPAVALRNAQLDQHRQETLTTLADGLGLICISTARTR